MATSRKRQRADSDGDSDTAEVFTAATTRKRQGINRNKDPVTAEPSSSNLTQLHDLARCIDKVHAADSGAFIKQLVLQLAV